MDFQPTEDQKALRDGIRSFCEGQVPNERFPDLEKSKGFDRALWSELARSQPAFAGIDLHSVGRGGRLLAQAPPGEET